MAVTAPYEQPALSVSTTELSLISGTSTLQNNTTAGVYQLFVDGVANMAKGDRFRVKVYEKVRSGGTKRAVFQADLYNAQSEPLCTPPLMLLQGWDMTIQKIAGTDRAFDTSIRKAG
jgi:hypothetical protein